MKHGEKFLVHALQQIHLKNQTQHPLHLKCSKCRIKVPETLYHQMMKLKVLVAIEPQVRYSTAALQTQKQLLS